MASLWSHSFNTKSILKILIVFAGGLVIYSFVNFRTSSFSTSSLDTNPPVPKTSVTRESMYLGNFASYCSTNQLDILSKQPNGNYSYRLSKTSHTTRCPRELREADSAYPKTWLVSQPGSGNTWMRHLLQQLTGLHTGSVYFDKSLRRNGFPYESRTNNVVAIKAHSLFIIQQRTQTKLRPETDRLILLIRNPYSSLLADYKRGRMKLKHTGNAVVDSGDVLWRDYICIKAPRWRVVLRTCLRSKLKKLIVFYEDLRSDLLYQLVRLATFLSDETLTEFGFCCAVKYSEGNHHREHSNQTEEDVFTTDNRLYMNALLTDLAESVQVEHPTMAGRLKAYRMPVV